MNPTPTNPETVQSISGWQLRLLPLMSRVLVSLAVFFFIITCVQLYLLQTEFQREQENYLPEVLSLLPAGGHFKDPMIAAELKARIVLEEQIIRRNYRQASILLLSRTWVRYLGFVTGMIMAFVGAAFILGKLTTDENTVETKTAQASLSLRSSSPGLILAGMGTMLILASIVINHQITTQHNSVYLQGMSLKTSPIQVSEPEPPALPEIQSTDFQSDSLGK